MLQIFPTPGDNDIKEISLMGKNGHLLTRTSPCPAPSHVTVSQRDPFSNRDRYSGKSSYMIRLRHLIVQGYQIKMCMGGSGLKHIAVGLAVLLVVISSTAAWAIEKCEIFWLHPEQPPLIITKGYGTGMGTIDRMEAFFKAHLTSCRHRYESGNYERILRMIKKKENACCIPLYKTPDREQFIEFSLPYQIVLSNALIIQDSGRKKIEPFLNHDGKVSLEALLARGLRIGVAKGRIYRGIIDETLSRYRNTPSVVEHDSPEQMINSLVAMMVSGRIDALIAYPMEAQYVAKSMQIKVLSLPVAGMDDYGLTSVGCSKTKAGKEIIRKLNTIILKHRTAPEFMDYTEHWLDPSALERHRTFTGKAFGNRITNSPQTKTK